MIKKEEEQAETYIRTISKLEGKERDMLNKLKKTQTQHALVAEDLERINRNQEPTGPLASLKNQINSSDRKHSTASYSRTSPKKDPKPQPPVKKMSPPPAQEITSSYYDRMYGEHQLYNVTDFYR